jgi:hypothetical protein
MISPNEDLLSFAVKRESSRRSIDLPKNFPNVDKPRFCEGEKIRWIPQGEKTDCGVVLGRFYNYAPHQKIWMWYYIIWLDKNSPSASWILADTAWEDDLEPFIKRKFNEQ